MNEVVGKIKRLLDSGTDESRTQAIEMIISIEDPDVDNFILSGITPVRD